MKFFSLCPHESARGHYDHDYVYEHGYKIEVHFRYTDHRTNLMSKQIVLSNQISPKAVPIKAL